MVQRFTPICLVKPSFPTLTTIIAIRRILTLTKLPENAEATQSVVQAGDANWREGAIGYRQIAVISGQKAMAVPSLQDGSHPPFGAEVKTITSRQVGLVDDDGNVYLAGVKRANI